MLQSKLLSYMHEVTAIGRTAGLFLVTIVLATGAAAQERRILTGHVPAEAHASAAISRLPATSSLNLAIGLPVRDQSGLTQLVQEVSDPASPNYRHYLTPEQFTERFGPTEADYQAVIAFAKAQGLTVKATHPHRMLLDVAGAVADIERAFQVRMRTYQHPTEAREFYAPDTEPSVEAGVLVLDVSGLSNFRVPHPKYHRPMPLSEVATLKPKATGSFAGGQFIGSDFRAAYAPGVALDGTGQMVGLVEFDGYYAGDILSYETLAHLPNVPLLVVLLDGFNGVPTTGADSGNGEVALDIEMVISMAPGLSNVVVYEAGPSGLANDVLSAMSTNTAIKQFSCSWDFGTTPRTTMDNLFLKLAAQGQSFFDASGDSGAFTGDWPEPDDDPYVTLVGGTTLATCATNGAWLSETAWNAPDLYDATSGGYTANYSIAATATWQQGISMSANQGSTTLRNIPDVAMVADDILIVADNGQQEVSGGTSASVQLWAAFNALANQQAAASGQSAVGFINPAIYALGKSASYAAVFNDVTVGNNSTNNGAAPVFPAVAGYDLCTGWGSPVGSSFILALATPDRLVVAPGRGVAANGPAGGPFTITGQGLYLTNAGTSALNWSLGNTSLWLNVSATGGALTPGGAAATVTLSLTPAAYTLAAGVYTANLEFTNTTSGLVQTRQFTLQVGQELVEDGGFESGDFAYWNLSGSDAAEYNFADDGTVYGSPAVPYDGNYFADLGQFTSPAYLSQTLPTLPGQLYLLSFYLLSANVGYGTTPNQFLAQWNGSTLTNIVNANAFSWMNLQYVVAATGTNTVLQFGAFNDYGVFGLDDVSVVPIPLPSVQSIVATNRAVNLTWRTMAGVAYQVQYKTNLVATNWSNLGGLTTATNNTLSASDTINPGAGRFYRIALVH
jgi:subtilase family serine protease